MVAGFLLTFREVFEAALIIGILFGVTRKIGKGNQIRFIWLGTLTAVITSTLLGYIIFSFGGLFEGRAEAIFEGITMLLAAFVLTWAIIWMQVHAKKLNKGLEVDAIRAANNNGFALFMVAFLAVFREGVELALFLIAALNHSGEVYVLIGTVLGLLTATFFSILFFKSLIRLNISKFFRLTSIILIIFAAGLVAHGVHELNEAHIIPSVIEHVWDINPILNENSAIGMLLKTMVGYNADPSLSEVLSYILFFIFLLVLKIRASKITV